MPPNPATDAWRRLRALATGADAGWFEYVAGDLGTSRHLVRIRGRGRGRGHGRIRELLRNEIVPWVTGVAAANSAANLDLLDEIGKPPPLLDIAAAAAGLGITADGVDYRVATGKLYPVYLPMSRGGRKQHLFAAQIAAATDGDAAVEEWVRIRALLPPATRIADVADASGPDLPIVLESGAAESTRRIRALRIGDGEGWFEYVHGDPGADRYTVNVYAGRHRTRREVVLPGRDVLPWTLGVADTHGHPELVVYREGIG